VRTLRPLQLHRALLDRTGDTLVAEIWHGCDGDRSVAGPDGRFMESLGFQVRTRIVAMNRQTIIADFVKSAIILAATWFVEGLNLPFWTRMGDMNRPQVARASKLARS